jgi:mRNA interferase HigB
VRGGDLCQRTKKDLDAFGFLSGQNVQTGRCSTMRVIKPATVREWMRQHPQARPGLEWWLDAICSGGWTHLAELRMTFPGADLVRVKSGRNVVVFNISGNAFRLIAAMHFNSGHVYALAFLTHAEYSKNRWKDNL